MIESLANLTDEDVREFSRESEIGYALLKIQHRRISGMNPSISLADTLYTAYLAKQNGLPILGNWYIPVPRKAKPGEKDGGFTVCFSYDAALYIVNHHPLVTRGTTKVWFTSGDGKRIEQDKSPSWKNDNEIDWGLSCTLQAEVGGKVVTYSCPYRQWVQYSFYDSKGNRLDHAKPTFIWMQKAGHMIQKQTFKEFSRFHLGATLDYEDNYQERPEDFQLEKPEELPVISLQDSSSLPMADAVQPEKTKARVKPQAKRLPPAPLPPAAAIAESDPFDAALDEQEFSSPI